MPPFFLSYADNRRPTECFVDALLGEETRLHQDLDIIIQQKDLSLC